MDNWVDFAVVVGVWAVLQIWLLPRMGVST